MTNHSAAPAAPHSADALKPCPFCGDEMKIDTGAVGFATGPGEVYVICDCGAMGAGGANQDDAIAAWNRRPTPADCESKTGEWSACQLRTIELYNMIHNRRPLNAERINTTPASPGLDNEAAARLRKQAEEAKKVRGVVALSPEDAFALLDCLEREDTAAGAVPEGSITGDEVTALAHKLISDLKAEFDGLDEEALNYCARGVGSLNSDILTFIKNRAAAPKASPLDQYMQASIELDVATDNFYGQAAPSQQAEAGPLVGPDFDGSPCAQCGDAGVHICEKSARGAAPSEPVANMHGPAYGIIDPDYARYYSIIRCTAWQYGYAIGMHGSFTRDLDLIAVPWADNACAPDRLVKVICGRTDLTEHHKNPTEKPHGRLVFTLMLPGFGDPRWVDLSIVPIATPPAQDAGTGEATIVAIGYESGFMATDPDHDGATVKLHYRDEATAEAAFCAITRIIDRAIANSGRAE